ncbi:hypothetical protein [Shinella sp. M31]|uniref:hypothetical protein n=1 Tax=Shinella sp. M31 TaxID=3368615 RepID=UPI003B9FA096
MKTTIAARICGIDHACAIPRDTLHLFEALHGSANALMARIRAGNWTADEIAAIIDYAIAPPKADASLEATMLRTRRDPESAAHRAIVEKGAATYVPLAIGLLLATLYGLPDEATDFTDEPDGPDA